MSDGPRAQDDMSTLKTRRKPHLSEIFPTRYGQHSGHLLFLDKAVYLFMQFVNLKQTVNITFPGIKQFLRKCTLINIMPIQEAEEKYAEINYYFSGDDTLKNGIGFHAFLLFLHHVAEKKFPMQSDALERMQRLLVYCDTALRHFGVRSARLRRTEIDTNNSETPVEIYMLPARLRPAKRRSRSQNVVVSSTMPSLSSSNSMQNFAIGTKKVEKTSYDRNNNNAKTFSLPRVNN